MKTQEVFFSSLFKAQFLFSKALQFFWSNHVYVHVVDWQVIEKDGGKFSCNKNFYIVYLTKWNKALNQVKRVKLFLSYLLRKKVCRVNIKKLAVLFKVFFPCTKKSAHLLHFHLPGSFVFKAITPTSVAKNTLFSLVRKLAVKCSHRQL